LNATLCQVSCCGYELHAGDVLLLEAFKDLVSSDSWHNSFGLVRMVPKSQPPRNGRTADFLRAVLIGTTLIGVFVLSGIISGDKELSQRLDLSVLCMLVLIGIFLIKGITVEEAYSEVNGPILMIIAGALAMGAAMQQTRFANCVADGVVALVGTSNFGLLIGIYLATAALGMVLNNAATVAIMGQIAISVSQRQGNDLGQMALLVTFGASACFMTPYGYQTNTFVAEAAGYSWGDFIKFGLPLQVMHMLMIVFLVPWLVEISPHGHPS
jgi:di/tricarboxylate transporter